MHFFAKSSETQDSGTKGWGMCYSCQQSLALVKVKTALYNEGSRSSASGDLGMIYGSKIYSPFLSTCCGHRGHRGNEWLLLLHHSSSSLSICLLQRASDRPPTTTAIMAQWRYQAERCFFSFKPWHSNCSLASFATSNTNSK